MKTCYTFAVEGSRMQPMADLTPPKMGLHPIYWWVNRINVPTEIRSVGHGNTLLKMVLADADADQVTLILEPLSSGSMSDSQLIDWYTRNGFRMNIWEQLIRRPRT